MCFQPRARHAALRQRVAHRDGAQARQSLVDLRPPFAIRVAGDDDARVGTGERRLRQLVEETGAIGPDGRAPALKRDGARRDKRIEPPLTLKRGFRIRAAADLDEPRRARGRRDIGARAIGGGKIAERAQNALARVGLGRGAVKRKRPPGDRERARGQLRELP